MLSVKFFDPGKAYLQNRGELLRTIDMTLSYGKLILQEDVDVFEEHLAEFVGTQYAVGLNSGTDALGLSLKSCGIGPGDEVITVSNTFKATVVEIIRAGATPVLIDIGEDYLMDTSKIVEAITPKTKAIIPVHLSGDVVDMAEVRNIAEAYDLFIIEDAAQALGATFNGLKAGSMGHVGCFRFYPAKLLGCFGDGGGITTNDEEIYAFIKSQRNHCKDGKGGGINSRLDNLQAAVLNVKLRDFDKALKKRREVAERYKELKGVVLPTYRNGREWQDYIIRTPRRDELFVHLKGWGIETMIPPVLPHEELKLPFPLPNSEKWNKEFLRLPCNEILTEDEISYIIEKVNEFGS